MGKQSWHKLEQVVCRTESRADQRPIKFSLKGRWVQVQGELSSWLDRGPGEKDPVYRVFEVDSELGRVRLRVAVDGWVWEYRIFSVAAERQGGV